MPSAEAAGLAALTQRAPPLFDPAEATLRTRAVSRSPASPKRASSKEHQSVSAVSHKFTHSFGAVVALGLMAHPIAAQSPTTRIVSAANAFLATLDAQQKSAVQFAWNDEQQRARWSNFPVQMSRRAGLRLHDLGAAQQSAARPLVSTARSRRGFEKVQGIMEGDEVLKAN